MTSLHARKGVIHVSCETIGGPRLRSPGRKSGAAGHACGTGLASFRQEAIMKRAALLVWIAVSTACAAKASLATAVQVEQITTGWVDAGLVDGKHKIVPAATFTVKNVSDRKLGLVQLNAVFRQVDDPKEWSSAYVPKAATELPPGALTGPITVKGEKGYTGDDPPDIMLSNPKFVDAKVELFVRSGSAAWAKIAEYPIERKLIAPSASSGTD
jgi:hypothetical protein